MSKVYTTEITSEELVSDNPIHQRLFKAYVAAEPHIHGQVLEVGCGEGRGIPVILPHASTYTAVDKIESALVALRKKYPSGKFISMNIPPFHGLADNTYDTVLSFQVIEHIDDDLNYLREIYRVMKPGGVALITTPNRKMSLTRNPWHVREYLATELSTLAARVFPSVDMHGITGNARVMAYYEENKRSVQRFTRFDIFDLQHRLPNSILRIPYELLNRWNRNKLQSTDSKLVSGIDHSDYLVVDDATNALDLLLIVRK
jgi:ubiquinone/menaquinone biosynthesis C-methylase UbiE